MTSGNDKKGPPAPAPRRPAPPPPSRPGGPTSGGAAARPPSTAPNTARPTPAARPAPAPAARASAPPADLDADAKTTAFNIADMGLEDDDIAPVAAPAPRAAAPAPAARAAAPAPRAPAPEPDEERTTAFNVADLPPEDDVRPSPSTLVSSKPGAAVRGGAAPIKRNETLALAPSAARAAVQQAQRPAETPFDDEKTAALSVDDIGKIEAMKAARIAAKAAAAAGAQAPVKPAAAAKIPAHIDEGERTMAVSLDDAIAAVDSAPPKKPSVVKSQAPAPKQAAAAFEDEKTSALSVDDIEKIELMKAARVAAKAAASGAGGKSAVPARAAQVKATTAGSAAPRIDLGASEGFIGAIGYAFKHDALEAQSESGKIGRVELDPARKSAGMRNLIIVGGALAALMLLFGILF